MRQQHFASLALLMVALAGTGCAPSLETAEGRLEAAKSAQGAGQYREALRLVADDLRQSAESPDYQSALALFRADEQTSGQLRTEFVATADALPAHPDPRRLTDPYEKVLAELDARQLHYPGAQELAGLIDDFGVSVDTGLLNAADRSAVADALMRAIDERVGFVPVALALRDCRQRDPLAVLPPELAGQVVTAVLLDLKWRVDPDDTPRRQVEALAEYFARSDPDRQAVRDLMESHLEDVQLSISEWRLFDFREARDRIEQLIVRVLLRVEPADRSLAETIRAKLDSASVDLVDYSGQADVEVVVRRRELDLDSRDGAPRTETVGSRQISYSNEHGGDFGTYQYDFIDRIVRYRWDYSIEAREANPGVGRASQYTGMSRSSASSGNGESTYRECYNHRVIDARGAVRPWNNEETYPCGQRLGSPVGSLSFGPLSESELRSWAAADIAKKIRPLLDAYRT